MVAFISLEWKILKFYFGHKSSGLEFGAKEQDSEGSNVKHSICSPAFVSLLAGTQDHVATLGAMKSKWI